MNNLIEIYQMAVDWLLSCPLYDMNPLNLALKIVRWLKDE